MSMRGKQDAAGALSTNKNRAELLKGLDIPWATTSAEDTQKHLYAKGSVNTPEVSMGMSILQGAMILYRITVSTLSVVTADACRAVGVLLERRRVDMAIKHVADEVARLWRVAEDAMKRDTADDGVAEHMRTAVNVLTKTVKEQCGEMETITGRLEESFAGLTERVQNAMGEDFKVSNLGATMTAPLRSYAAAAAPPPTHAAAVAIAAGHWTTIPLCETLTKSYNTRNWLVGMDAKAIVEKARLAVVLMCGEGSPPVDAHFVGAAMQCSGAVLLHMNMMEAVNWLKKNMTGFLSALGVGTGPFTLWRATTASLAVPW
ncbi:hypothetical protein B0H17DRAFT_1206657 [Mycena rosella]|uniref:Uncharacterized protein n=1 Tax=Mycena rosella TaxID=1033263 RepID=A0AAD7GCS0_MYCRO|nr:hypothetical protein B0H17DRAFT_1206657 [Mycena rosella]